MCYDKVPTKIGPYSHRLLFFKVTLQKQILKIIQPLSLSLLFEEKQ